MKKIIALILAAAMFSLAISLVSCGKGNDENPDSNYKSSLELLKKVWGLYSKDEKFPASGGNSIFSSGKPAAVNTVKNKDFIKSVTYITDELLDEVAEDAASLAHSMNAIAFSSAVFRLKNPSDASDFADNYKNAVQDTHWLCGFPDRVIVVSVGEYVIVAFGYEDLIDTFKAKCLEADSGARILVDEAV